MIASLAGAFVVACSGCGGGGGDEAPGTPADSPPVKDVRVVVIDCEGDSTMWGMAKDDQGRAYQTARSAPVVLQEALRLRVDGTVVVNNHGVPSASIGDSLSGNNEFYSAPWDSRLSASNAHIVIENYGLNDMKTVTPDQFYSNLAQWVHRVRVAGKIPVLEEPNPITRPGLPDVEPYVREIGRVASDYNVPLVKQYDYIKSLPNWQAMLPDGVHPSDALYEIKAKRVAEVVTPIIYSLIPQP
nr:SGNH/GDSL hydrolase family protein [Cupriavidus gilardii]